MPKRPFTEDAVPAFSDAPVIVLVVGDVEFFVEETGGRGVRIPHTEECVPGKRGWRVG